MKIVYTLLLAGGALTGGLAQGFPFEREADRKPTFQTGGDCLIRGARILTVTRGTIEEGDILIRGGKIAAIGQRLNAPSGVRVIEAKGKVVSPGLVDGHSHRASDATNEGTDSITAEVRIGDVLNPNNRNVWQALASGHTAGLILHGSANCVGGQSIVIKYKYRRSPGDLPVPDAPRMIKFALGENVTRSGATTSTRFPRSRMGVEALYRRSFEEAKQYRATWKAWEANPNGPIPRRDLRLETLVDILDGKVWVHCHSYRADEMLMMARLSKEYGFKLGALQHGLEAYKIAPELAEMGVGASIFVDNWSFKVEGYDGIPYNAAISTRAGVNVSVNTDGLGGTTALNIDAAKTMRYGGLSETEALATVTINPAKQLGIAHRTGSIEVGKDADLAIWDGHPLSVYSRPAMTLVEGEVFFERRDGFGVDKDSTIKARLDRPSGRTTLNLPARMGGTVALVGGTVYPVSGPPIENGTVVMRDGKIVAVGRNVSVPGGATRVDVRGLRVYPGMIDAGTSLGLAEIGPVPVTIDNRELGDFQPDVRALTALQVQTEQIPPARGAGLLAMITRPVGGLISGQGSLIRGYGLTTEEFGIVPSAGLFINFPGGAAGLPTIDPPQGCCGDNEFNNYLNGPWDMPPPDEKQEDDGHGHDHGAPVQRGGQGQEGGPEERETLAAYFDRAVKYDADRTANPNMPRDLRMEAMRPYVTGKGKVYLRVRTAASIRGAVTFAKRYKLDAVLVGAADAWKEADLLAKERIPVIITAAGRSTLFANAPVSDFDPYDTPYATPALLKRAGVRFCFQSEDNALAFNLPVRVGQHCAYGLSPEDALRALTLDSAEILGVADRLGSIEPGKMANVVVADGDPFELTSQILAVFIDGRPAPMESRFTRLRDQYAARLNGRR